MSNKITETRRALFEKKVVLPGTVKWSYEKGCYVGANFWLIQFGWDTFNAALDAVEIDLEQAIRTMPSPITKGTMWTAEVYAAIESTNLGLKVK